MKTVWIVAAITVVLGLLAVAGGAAAAIAYGRTAATSVQAPASGGLMPGMPGMRPGLRFNGRGEGFGPSGGMLGLSIGTSGPVHDAVIASLAKGLGLSVDELNSQLSSGQTLGAIANEKGLTTEQVCSLFGDARQAGVKSAVAAGEITQAQADRMLQDLGSQRCPAGFGGRFGDPAW